MSREIRHTPVPWEIGEVIDGAEEFNECANVRGIQIRGPRMAIACKDDADFILEAVNNYEALQAENERLKKGWKDDKELFELRLESLYKQQRRNFKLESENARLREALSKYKGIAIEQTFWVDDILSAGENKGKE